MADTRTSSASAAVASAPLTAGLQALGIVDLSNSTGSVASASGSTSASTSAGAGVGPSGSTPRHRPSHAEASSAPHDHYSYHSSLRNGVAHNHSQRHPQPQPQHPQQQQQQQQPQHYRANLTTAATAATAQLSSQRGFPTTADAELSAEALGLPPDAEITRVPDGERYRVRAVYDFDATDESALSFRAGDVIEVLTMLPSGWWDGMLGANRGWFPSNYVEDVDDEDDSRFGDYVEMAPDGRIIHRNGSTADILGVDESLGHEWGGTDWGVGSTTSLDDLALEMMEARGQHLAHLATAADENPARRRTDSHASHASRVSRSSRASYQSAGRVGPATVTTRAAARRSGTSGTAGGGGDMTDDELHQDPDETVQAVHAQQGRHGHGDAWVPTLGADGRVYYLNTLTGEEAYDMPEGEDWDTSRSESRASSRRRDESANHTAAASSSHPFPAHLPPDALDPWHNNRQGSRAVWKRNSAATMLSADDFRVPANRTRNVQFPWIARLTDDGRSWFYTNQLTGETRREPPPPAGADGVLDSSLPSDRAAARRSVGGVADVTGAQQHSVANRPLRGSSLAGGQADWEERIRGALAPLYAPSPQPVIGELMDKLRDAVNDLYAGAATGSDAQNEKAAAGHAHAGMQHALDLDAAACAEVNRAERFVVDATRELFAALGYVGPTIPPPGGHDSAMTDELQRPHWCNDMSLVGVLGLIASTVRVATEGLRSGASSPVPWDNVMRAATKMRATLDAFPAISHMDQTMRDTTAGRRLVAWFGAESVSDFMSGRFGFGRRANADLRPLDQTTVVELQKLKAEVDAALRASAALSPSRASLSPAAAFDLVRTSSSFRDAVAHIDVAVVIDLDGDQGSASDAQHPEDARTYTELVARARTFLRDLDEAFLALDAAGADVFLRAEEPTVPQTREAVGQAASAVFRALSSLLVIAQQQAATVEQGVVRGSIGGRSSAKILLQQQQQKMLQQQQMLQQKRQSGHGGGHTRGPSITSLDSRASQTARVQEQHKRNESVGSSESRNTRVTAATGSEQEFLDGDEARRQQTAERPSTSSNRLSRTSQPSASGSQTSLVKPAGSSSTSLIQQQDSSEAGSVRGSNRSSILKAVPSFLRSGRSNDNDMSRKNKKLSRIKDDRNSMLFLSPTQIPTPPSSNNTPPGPQPTAPMSAPPPQAMRSSPPWYLSSDYAPGEIVFDAEKHSVKAGTIRALIERLTPHTSADTSYFQAFLLTYRSFVTTDDLVALLLERYKIAPPPDLAEDQLKDWTMRKQTPIRLRVVNTLKAWLEHHYMDETDHHALGVVEDFAATTLVANNSELMSKQLLQLVDRRRRGDSMQKSRIVMGAPPPPNPLQPRVSPGKPLQLMDISPIELARQLTVLDSNMFIKIKPAECLGKAWQRENAAKMTPNVGAVIDTSIRLAGLVQKLLVSYKDLKLRAAAMGHLIRTASECRQLNNFQAMSSLVAGLGSASVHRLRRTWEQVTPKARYEWNELQRIVDPTKNFAMYKETLKTINPPCVPWFGTYTHTLVFIEDGNRDNVPAPLLDADGNVVMARSTSTTSGMTRATSLASSGGGGAFGTRSSLSTSASGTSTHVANGNGNGHGHDSPSKDALKDRPMLINFFKRQLTADILRDILQYQTTPYNLATCKPVYEWLEASLQDVSEDDEDYYAVSCVLEPRESHDPLVNDAHLRVLATGSTAMNANMSAVA